MTSVSLSDREWIAASVTRLGLATVTIAGVLVPVFLVIYRLMAFATVPRDDYAPFLLWLVGAPGGAFPGSPYGYRILSVALAALFYPLPEVPLTNLPAALEPAYLHATAAIAMTSAASMLLAAVLAYRNARLRCGLGAGDALIAAGLLFALCWYSQFFALDPLSICWIMLCRHLLETPRRFAAAMLVAPAVNEKIVMVLALALAARCLADQASRRMLSAQCATVLAALLGYAAALHVAALPGNAYQLNPANYMATALDNLRTSLSPRGAALNLVPALLMAALAACAWRGGKRLGQSCWHPAEMVALPGMLLAGLMLTEKLQLGRMAVHAAPLAVVPAAAWLGRRLEEGEWISRAPG